MDHQPRATIAKSANSCISSFQDCVQWAKSIHQRELSLVEDQLASFSIWAASVGALAPGRESLDHHLHDAPDTQDVVISLLESLTFYIQSCSSCLESIHSKESRDPLEPLGELDPEFEQSIRGITDEVNLLHKLANTVRRVSKNSQIQKAESFRIRDDEGNDAESLLSEIFLNHIRDKFPAAEENIRQRLADTMVFRRKRILYKRSRYGNTHVVPQSVASEPQTERPRFHHSAPVPEQSKELQEPRLNVAASKNAIQPETNSTATAIPSDLRKASVPSQKDDAFPQAPIGKIKQKYTDMKAMSKQDSNATFDPKLWADSVKAIGEVLCPFCFYIIPAHDVAQDHKWKIHVEKDLDAYVCVFKDCDSPHQLYNNSISWFQHMRTHFLRWRCKSKLHGEIMFESKDNYISHMRAAHQGKYSEARLQSLAGISGRAINPLFTSCPLCGEKEVDGDMDDHIADHLRSLAIISLPAYQDEGEEGKYDGTESLFSSEPSRDTIKNDPDMRTQLTFDHIDEAEGHSTDFDQIKPGMQSIFEILGGYWDYLGQFSSGAQKGQSSMPNVKDGTFSPPPEDDLVNSVHDPSLDFVDDSLFDGIQGANRRQFEWGFLPTS